MNACHTMPPLPGRSLFAGSSSEQDLAVAGDADERSRFYANLYLGLYAECRGSTDAARHYMSAAAASGYGRRSGDYMHTLALVHVRLRGW